MGEVGIDLCGKGTRGVSDVWKSGQLFAYVITVCDESSAEGCPIFPGDGKKLHWGFPDPSALTGSREEQLARVREIRDDIRRKVESWCDEVCARPASA